ncbi:MAG: hypothetical protein M1832_004890 [Thelocarpon impressellum]|nr:MAG: hypothetical protein M1832_004890 [Thelocarpon impressellum]
MWTPIVAPALALTFLVSSALAADPSEHLVVDYIQPMFPKQSKLDSSPKTIGLVRRQNNCPANFISCAGVQNTGACCQAGTSCQLDQAGRVACCPNGAQCSGTLNNNNINNNNGFQPNNGNGFIVIGTSTSYYQNNNINPGTTFTTSNGIVVPVTTTSFTTSNGIVVPVQTTSYTTSNGIVVPVATTTTTPQYWNGGIVSSVTNQYYTYPALPTTFANAALCSSGFQDCQTEYQKCTAALGANANGIAITGPNGGGVTVVSATVTLGPSATSICSSLSQSACRNLVLSSCATYGVNGVRNAAPTGCIPVYAAGIGVALGVAGQVMA